jgi:uncharacterized membrane protein
MDDPRPPDDGPDESSSSTGTSGLDSNVASALTYVAGWVTGLIFLLIEKEDQEVRFHAAQSIVLSVVFIVVGAVLSIVGAIPIVGLIVIPIGFVVGLGGFILWLYLIVQAFGGNRVTLPIVGDFAEGLAARQIG